MASPQLEDGYTKIANEILENLARLYLRSNQWQVLICIFRKVYGYNKKEDYITNSQIVLDTGLKKEVVSRSITDMVARNILVRDKKVVGFQKDWERWKLTVQSTIKSCINSQPELTKQSTKVDGSLVIQKKKETIQKKTPTPFKDDGLFDTFWKEYPKKIGKVVAEKAFYKHKPTPELLEKMLLAIQEQKKSDQWVKDGGQFIPHPSTWLNQKRWEDELTISLEEPRGDRSAEAYLKALGG